MDEDVKNELLQEWLNAVREVNRVKPILDKERELRKSLFSGLFPEAEEGTNNYIFSEELKIQGTLPYDRKVDKVVLQAIGEECFKNGVDIGRLIEWEPKLVLKEYRKLTKDQLQMFDLCITTKPGSISMKAIVKEVSNDDED